VTVNLVAGRGALLIYPLSSVLAIVVLGMLGAVLVAAGGVLISLRAATVRQAEQTLGGAIMVVLFVPLLAIKVMPAAIKARLATGQVTAATLSIIAIGALVAVDVGMVALAMRRFQRARLIADV
jgi:ABC-2 type transport system permease protein